MNAEAVAAALHHLLEITGPIEHRSAPLTETAEPGFPGNLLLSLGLGSRRGNTEQLLGQPLGFVLRVPTILPTGPLRHTAGLTRTQPKVAAVGTPQIGGQTISSKLAEVDLGDADGWSIAVVTDLAHLVTDLARPRESDGLTPGLCREGTQQQGRNSGDGDERTHSSTQEPTAET